MASYTVNPDAVSRARELIGARQYVLNSDWGDVQPRAAAENAFLETHTWSEYAQWHLGLTEGAADETKAATRSSTATCDGCTAGLIACDYRAAEWRPRRSRSPRTTSVLEPAAPLVALERELDEPVEQLLVLDPGRSEEP